jgi:hypothetical protein
MLQRDDCSDVAAGSHQDAKQDRVADRPQIGERDNVMGERRRQVRPRVAEEERWPVRQHCEQAQHHADHEYPAEDAVLTQTGA